MEKKYIILFVVAMIVAGFAGFWLYREQIFSKEILKVEILGPDTAKMGQEIEYTVRYKNNGNFVLEDPRLIFELPENSLTEENKTRTTQSLKDIYPGEEGFVKFKGVILGKEGDLKAAHAWLSYKPKNLSARYESDTTFTTKIEQVPITLDFDLPTKLEKGKEISYAVNYFSNVEYPLENLSIKIEPIDGFVFKSSEPVSLDESEWKLAVLKKSQGGRITIRGTMGTNTQNKIIFSAKLGMWVNGSFVIIKEAYKEIETINPLLFISQQVNGFPNYVASPGETLRYEIFFRNIGSTSFSDLFAIYRVDQNVLDLSSLESPDGQVKPNDNLIIFDHKQISKLRQLNPNQEARVEFSVKVKDFINFSEADKNNMVIKNRINIFDITEEFQTKISSKLDVSQKAFYQDTAGMDNSGPIPPEVGKTTTYIIAWQVKNNFNDVKNIKVRATLPQGIGLVDEIIPEGEANRFSFDNVSREILWSAGDLQAGGASTVLYFKIALTPESFHAGKTVQLIGQATASGEDQSTNKIIQGVAGAVDTNLPDDSENSGKGVVE